jgi:protein-cysteine N-palmitoyltransferase HHAT
MMMIANLIGFCVGLDGITDLIKGMIESYYGIPSSLLVWQNHILLSGPRQRLILGWALAAGVFASLFVGVQVMFEIREDERRRGIKLRC